MHQPGPRSASFVRATGRLHRGAVDACAHGLAQGLRQGAHRLQAEPVGAEPGHAAVLLVEPHAGSESALDPILDGWVPPETRRPERKSEPETLADLIGQISERERREILAALEWSRGSVAGAARRLRIPRSTLRHRMYRYSIVQSGRRDTETD